MNRLLKNKNSLLIILLTVFIILSSLVGGGIGTAFAASSTYSDVLDDLQAVSDFNASDYTANEKDYSLNVIQIAESANKELFIYVYQPSGASKDLTAASVSLSTTTGDNVNPKVYTLSKLNSNGVFYKYKVNNFTVSTDSTRYYNIVEIWRKYDSSIDSGTGNDNTINEVTNSVAQLWTVTGSGDEIYYHCTDTEVITILNPYAGFIRYTGGFALCKTSCDSFYVAFDTDKQIDTLMSAKVSYAYRSVSEVTAAFVGTTYTYGDWISTDVIVSSSSHVSGKYSSDGFFVDTSYSWDRIESTSDFIKDEAISDTTNFKNTKWVLRFAEYDYELDTLTSSAYYTEVQGVTILELEFETSGTTHKMAAVMDKISGSLIPTKTNKSFNWLAFILGLIFLIIIVILFYPVLSPILSFIVKGIIWVITLPFKLIGALFKDRGNKK